MALSSCTSEGVTVGVDNNRIMRLYEASLTVTVRMRHDPSSAQLLLDQMSFVDILRVQNVACGATSFFEFALQVLQLPGVEAQISGPELVKNLPSMGYSGREKRWIGTSRTVFWHWSVWQTRAGEGKR